MDGPAGYGPGGSARVVAVCNLKGGAGKSTLAVNLACAFAELGGTVSLVDNDEQGTAATWAKAGRLPIRCVHLPLPSAEALESWLQRFHALRVGPNVLVVDFPATVAVALGAALLAASTVLVPCAPNELEIVATRRMMRHVARLRAERRADPPTVLVVPNRVGEPWAGSLKEARARLAALGEELAPAIGAHPEYARAFAERRWVGDLHPGSAAHRELLALANLVCDRFEAPVPALGRSATRGWWPRPLVGWATRWAGGLGAGAGAR
jgi:chromosome partitioning protein